MTRWACLVALAGCYDPPQPSCGFACGPGTACPSGYTCAFDGFCHTPDVPVDVLCYWTAAPDAAVTGPHIIEVQPAVDQTGVDVNVVPIVFADSLLMGVTHHSVYMLAGDTLVDGNTNFVGQDTLFSWVPTSQLAPNTTYTMKVTAAVTDVLGDPLGPYQWSFTTGVDRISPQIQYVTPFPGSPGVSPSATISVQFDEDVVGVDATSFTVTDGGVPIGGEIATTDHERFVFTPVTMFRFGSEIDVALSTEIQDAYGNRILPFSFSFTTL